MGHQFDIILTREFKPNKPHPAPILHCLKQWNLTPDEVIMIGDDDNDIHSGLACGTRTCLINDHNESSLQPTYRVKHMLEVLDILKNNCDVDNDAMH